jgi:hypothetical protein
MTKALGRTNLFLFLIVLVAVSCQQRDSGRSPELESLPAQRLVGIWDVSLHLATPFPLAPTAPSALDITGALALVENHYGDAAFGQMGRPLHYGSYDLNLAAFGLDPSGASEAPTAIAQTREVPIRLSNGAQVLVDSVEIVLNPGHADGWITLRGQFQRELVIGAWSAVAAWHGKWLLLNEAAWIEGSNQAADPTRCFPALVHLTIATSYSPD